MANNEINDLEQEIAGLMQKLNVLQKASTPEEIPNYTFATLNGNTSLLDFFGEKDKLLMIHNMGKDCRYCTLWADGFNGLLAHLESAMSVVLVSKDSPETQRRFAEARGWRFHMASHGGGDYIRDQAVFEGSENAPGAVLYQRDGDKVFRKNKCSFGPGDIYCSMWSLLGLAGIGEEDWIPQYTY